MLRRVGGMWFDLDSLKPAPQPIGNHELVHVLQQVMADGFTAFVPPPLPSRTSLFKWLSFWFLLLFL